MRKDNLKFEYCLFQKSAIKGVFNKKNANDTFAFNFIKFSKPKADYLIESGVVEVVQSWKSIGKHKIKTLHSGLFNLGEGIYIGNNINEKDKKDFILLYVKDKNQIQFFLVKNCNPKKNKFVFTMDLFEHFKSLNLIKN
jgi:hypothetical protein